MNYETSPAELKAIVAFRERHKHGTFQLILDFGSGVGTVLIIKCKTCKQEKDITDYDNW